MKEEEGFELADRLLAMDEDKPKRRAHSGNSPTMGRAIGGLLMLGVVGGVFFLAVETQRGGEDELATAEVDDWQGSGNGFESMPPLSAGPPPSATLASARPEEVPMGPSPTEQALLDRLTEMQEQLDAMREGQSNPVPAEDGAANAQIDALSRQLDALRDEADTLRDEADDARRASREAAARTRELEGDLAAARAGLEAAQFDPSEGTIPPGGPPVAVDEGVPLDTEAARIASLEDRRAAAEAEREARVTSPMIAFGGSAAAGEAIPVEAPDLEQDEGFLRAGARPVVVEQASVIANPSRTVVQGTVIQAALETAIDSSLPGAIRAVVSEDVHSFDGTRVLIPRGSKLIGRYDSQLVPTQRRILIAWDRIVTPDGQSATIAAYGADELGRSGTTGRIDRRLGTRFGTAALVSLVAAVPRLAGAALDDPFAADLAVDLGGDAEDAASSVLEPFLAVPPTITVDQGARITVLVDRDLELSW